MTKRPHYKTITEEQFISDKNMLEEDLLRFLSKSNPHPAIAGAALITLAADIFADLANENNLSADRTVEAISEAIEKFTKRVVYQLNKKDEVIKLGLEASSERISDAIAKTMGAYNTRAI